MHSYLSGDGQFWNYENDPSDEWCDHMHADVNVIEGSQMNRGKVFGGVVMKGGKPYRAVIYEASQKRAARIANTSLHEFRNYWSVTGNEAEIVAAKAQPSQLVLMKKI